MEKRGASDRRYLTNSKIQRQFLLIAYILKSTKNQRSNPFGDSTDQSDRLV